MLLLVRSLLLQQLLLLLLDGSTANRDPTNATVLLLPVACDPPRFEPYNITHRYFRQAFHDLGVRAPAKALRGLATAEFDCTTYRPIRCMQTRLEQHLRYWLNPYEMPGRLYSVNAKHETHAITDRQAILETVGGLVARVFSEMELQAIEIERESYYRLLDRLLLSEGQAYQGLLPIQIHFRQVPYPQSSFMEFVSDRALVWTVYDSSVYASYAGLDNDLLYRLRHNLRHTLGLGHLHDRESIMFPTNVRGLTRPSDHDVDAVHALLCSIYGNMFPAAGSESDTARRRWHRGHAVDPLVNLLLPSSSSNNKGVVVYYN